MKKYLILFLFLYQGYTCFAQDNYKNDIITVSRHMSLLKKYSVVLKYSMYVNNDLSKPFQTREVNFNQQNGKLHLVQSNDNEIIQTDAEQINVDHKGKLIVYTNIKNEVSTEQKDEEDINALFDLANEKFDSLTTEIEKVSLSYNQNNIKEYTITYKKGEYTKQIIRLNMKNRTYLCLTAFYREKEIVDKGKNAQPKSICMKVEYENFNTNPTFSPAIFNISQFVRKNANENVQLNQNYKNYKLTTF